jgi:hypothetical protein
MWDAFGIKLLFDTRFADHEDFVLGRLKLEDAIYVYGRAV